MSSTTALITVGTMHPNDGCINPTHLIQLHEGNRAAWTLHELSDQPAPMIIWRPDRPEAITITLLALLGARLVGHPVSDERLNGITVAIEPGDRADIDRLAIATRSASRFALVATVFAGSSLDVAELKALTNHDVKIATVTYSRTWSPWTDSWEEADQG